ncbi:MAG: hypothetical protein AAB627_01060, partial [Patescibacteria group bacterium]
MVSAEEIVRAAKQSMEASGDHKCWARKEEMLALIAAGARVIRNFQQYNGTYVIEVIYEEISFTHTSRDPLLP